MPKRSSKKKAPNKKRPADANQFAKVIVDEPTQEADQPVDQGKNPAAVALGRLGGKKGGPARAEKLTAERRSKIAKKAAETRWSKSNADA